MLTDTGQNAGCHTAYVGLGANLGDAARSLARAREALAALPGCLSVEASDVYFTEPQGRADQPWFRNQVLRLRFAKGWTPETLLAALLKTEATLGRTRDAADRLGPRAIDLDLLLFDQETRRENAPEALCLPHPRMSGRAFVLVPLQEIAPGLIIPDGQEGGGGTRVEDLLAALPHRVADGHIYQ